MDITYEGIKRLCSAMVILAAKDYYSDKNQRISIMKFISSGWGAEIIDCSDYPHMTPELFQEIAQNSKIKRYANGWDRKEDRIKRGNYKKRGNKND